MRAANFKPPVLPEPPAFATALEESRQLAMAGDDAAAWTVIRDALTRWQPDSPYRIVPAVLLTDPVFRAAVTPERAREVVAAPLGGRLAGAGSATSLTEPIRGRYRPGTAASGSVMRVEQTLVRQSLTSPSGAFVLCHQHDGNLVLYSAGGRAVWSAGTFGRDCGECLLQHDGNLVVYDSQGQAVWASGTAGQPVSRLRLGDDGIAVLERDDGIAVWASSARPPRGVFRPGTAASGSRVLVEQTLRLQSLTSPGGAFVLTHGDNGDVVVRRNIDGRPYWSAGTGGTRPGELVLQRDGNLVVYDSNGRARWASKTQGEPAHCLTLRDDGIAALEAVEGRVLWTTEDAP